jgi:uncharacterized membrane protein
MTLRVRPLRFRASTTDSARAQASAEPVAAGRSEAEASSAILISHRLVWFFVLVGVALRTWQYAVDRSLWLDESYVALNLFARDLGGLLSDPLDFNQAAPAGFLVVEEFSSLAFGKSEYALRAFPFVSGLAAIPLFILLARRILSSVAVPVAVGLFAVSGPLVYYSSEVKPYSTDVAAALGLYVVSLVVIEGRLTFARAAAFGLLGAVLIQLSYAAIFVAAGCGAVILGISLIERRFDSIRPTLLVLACWALGAFVFLGFYLFSFQSYTGYGGPTSASAPGPFSNGAMHWWWARVTDVSVASGFYNSFGTPLVIVSVLATVLAAVGATELLFRRRNEFALLIAPVVVTVGASAAGKFPILGRTVLFLSPIVFLFIANGAVTLVRRVRVRTTAAAVAIFVVLSLDAASLGSARPFVPSDAADIKESLSFVGTHWRTGDVLYVHYPSQYAFGYYSECECFSLPRGQELQSLWPVKRTPVTDPGDQFPRAFASTTRRLIIGAPPWRNLSGNYKSDVNRISSHKRGWVIVTWTLGQGERDFIRETLLTPLGRRGTVIASIAGESTYTYLYDFEQRVRRRAASVIDRATSAPSHSRAHEQRTRSGLRRPR